LFYCFDQAAGYFADAAARQGRQPAAQRPPCLPLTVKHIIKQQKSNLKGQK
jgi:hypothetical protein